VVMESSKHLTIQLGCILLIIRVDAISVNNIDCLLSAPPSRLLRSATKGVGGHTGTAGVRVRSNATDQLDEREKRDECYVACPTDALETTVLIVARSINIHQDDHCRFLDPHASTCLTAGRTHPSHIIILR